MGRVKIKHEDKRTAINVSAKRSEIILVGGTKDYDKAFLSAKRKLQRVFSNMVYEALHR